MAADITTDELLFITNDIFMLRRIIIPRISYDSEKLMHGEDLLHQANILITRRIKYRYGYIELNINYISNGLNETGQTR